MQHDSFEAAYKKLNAEQKEAVDTTEGPVMVVAGPGTGKTQILTLRIANILRTTDTRPEQTLALTFTESGARAMRERLRSYIGSEAYRVPIYTFHGFSDTLIRAYPDAYERVIGGRPATDIEKVEIVEDILSDSTFKYIRPLGNPAFYVPHILRAIGVMKQEYMTPHDLSALISKEEGVLSAMVRFHEKGAHKGKVRSEYQKKERSIEKLRELLAVYQQYQALLSEKRLYDFDDMIVETIDALSKNEDMLRDLQETYQYILADEHQDVNGSQNKILELLSSYHAAPNIFVVGDEKQAIYRFQGASLENFLYFEDVYPDTKTIALTESYRSGQRILDASHSLIHVDEGPASELRVPLHAHTEIDAHITLRAFTHEAVENEWLVHTVQEVIEAGTEPNEIAVIVRTNREVEALAAALRATGVPANASADGDILEHTITHRVRALIDAVAKPESEDALFRVLHGSYWSVSPADLACALAARSTKFPLQKLLADAESLTDAGIADPEALMQVGEVLAHAREKEATDAPHRVLQYVLSESGFLDAVMKQDPHEGARVLRRLYDEIEELVRQGMVRTLAEVSAMFDRRREHTLPLNAPYIRLGEQAVTVLTAHKSKGLEFEHVFMPHLTDSVWGNKRSPQYFDIPLTRHLDASALDRLDDERRLFYVGMTRAKQALHFSYAETNSEGREFVPSRFLADIDEACVEAISTKAVEKAFDPLDSLAENAAPAALEKDFLRTMLLERGLSPTALNNYLQSPWDYLYRNVFHIPEPQSASMLYGTALHKVLERYTAERSRTGLAPTDADVKRFLDDALGRLPLTVSEYTRFHERGLTALIAYVAHMTPALPLQTKEEFRLRVALPTGADDLPEVPLTGMIDRIDLDEGGNALRVVDYKSGAPKTRGVIEGKTKDSNGNYKRQLVFYALLLSLYDDERYRCREALISFVEPDTKGAIREESFTITDEEIDELKAEIIRVSLEIAHGSFLNEPCDPSVSNYCELVWALQEEQR